MTLYDDMKAQNEMLRMRLAETLHKSRNDAALIDGMHKIIIRCGDLRGGGRMKPDDVCKAFRKLKKDVFGDSDE